MKYFIDTEFCEKPNTIDLISIGIVCEDGREYYALNKECNLKSAIQNEWIEDNVLLPIYCEYIHGDMRNQFPETLSSLKWVFKNKGETIKDIKKDLLEFFDAKPDFYGYYADYDWVVFCWIFGRMVDLPDNYPYYCKDLKQMMDERGLTGEWKKEHCPDPEGEHNALVDARWNMKLYNEIFTGK